MIRREYTVVQKSGGSYFGSVAFFRHLIYLFLIAVILAGMYGIYVLFDKILIDYVKGWIASIDEYQTSMSQKGRINATTGSGTKSINGQPGITDKGAVDVETDLTGVQEDSNSGLEETSREQTNDVPSGDNGLKETNYTIGYQHKYPELYCKPSNGFVHKEKVAYLTFDDGPSSRTQEVLDILRKYNIKATFFVVTSNTKTSLLKRIAEEGHAIGIHTNSHVYRDIYRSVEAFLDDFYAAYQKVYEETGIKAEIFRFPGGSLNAYNMGIYQEIIAEMLRRGFIYYDWNISTNDSNPKISAKEIIKTIKNSVDGQNKLIILCHDSEQKYETVKALPGIIEFLKKEGYTFEKLDNTVEPVVFSYR
ncbi:MAG: polysaccharide deacetylase [Clostridiales bacterium]|mgnify:CR=1 FL=1|jgi:peptidoglycan/xylan/chitin deacetylase (PgdA/CDA1 family)|nr:polysaccharide deacetylase [Clostridiales bacterium]